jgi:sulfite exporter TauE/SafE
MSVAQLSSLFFLGLLGSAHCIGMCGPLVLIIPEGKSRFISQLLYNLGRITTYTIIGAVFGLLGSAISELATQAGKDPLLLFGKVQLLFSFLAAAFLFWFGLIRLSICKEPAIMQKAMPSRIPGFSSIHSGVVADRSVAACYLFGVLLGFLPCGLSYGAFVMALAAGGPLQGGLSTLAFGLGTLPALFLLGTAASGIVRRHQKLFDLLAGLVMIFLAISLVTKGISRF